MKKEYLAIVIVLAVIVTASNPGPQYPINLAKPLAVSLSASLVAGLDSFWTCPPNTDYVLLPVANTLVADPNTYSPAGFIANFRIMGCCQPNSFGCISDKNSRIQGCCPVGQVCCYDPIGVKIGCADSINQCCGNSICPTGWGCCKGIPQVVSRQAVPTGSPTPLPAVYNQNTVGTFQCCPLPPMANINDQSTFCEINVTTNAPQGCQLAYSSTFDYCPYVEYAYYIGFVPTDPNAFVFDFPVPCSQDISQTNTWLCANYTIKCPDPSQCAYVQAVTEWNYYNETSLITQTELMNQSRVVGCCPAGYELCHGVFGQNLFSFGGCANTGAGETCCGKMICPPGTRCCEKTFKTTRPNPISGLPEFVTFTIPMGCCPPELDCCLNHTRSSGRRNSFVDPFYCGEAFNGQDCALNKWQEPFWYNLIQTQDYGLITGVTP